MPRRTLSPKRSIDPPIRGLVNSLNKFNGISTIGSCGGHPEPLQPGQWATGTWYVKFRVEHSDDGWHALEFLAWLVNNDYARCGHQVTLYPIAPPPYLNEPGQVLAFALEGYEGEDPNALATWVNQLRRSCYVPPGVLPDDNDNGDEDAAN
jgi:hypothetical protein